MNDSFFPGHRLAAISLSFDDARPSQIDIGIPLLADLGLAATFYVSPGAMLRRVDEWRAAYAAGHEIGNHSLNHACTGNFPWSRNKALEDYTLDQMEREILEANRVIHGALGITPTTFAYPCGLTYVGRGLRHASYVPIIARHFICGRGFRGETANDPGFCDPAHLFAYDLDDRPFESIKTLVDRAISDHSWLVFAGHNFGDGGFQVTRTDALKQLATYLRERSHEIWCAPICAVGAHLQQRRQTTQPITV